MASVVLLRHGESVWNRANVFTGWTDVELSDKGIAEARAAGQLLAADGYTFDVAHTSVLRRAVDTLNLVLEEMSLWWVPVAKTWRLNERMYGALQGLNKKETVERHGSVQIHLWRRSYDVPPPALDPDDERHPGHDRRYESVDRDLLPSTECLRDVVDRMLPYWFERIVPDIEAGKRVLIAAHGNSLRALVKHLDGVGDDAIAGLNIPTGIPLVYRLGESLRAVEHFYLGDPEEAAAAAEAVARQTAT